MTIASWYNRCALAVALLAVVAYSTASGSPEFAVLAVPTLFALWRFSCRKTSRFLLPRFVVNILLFAVLAYAALRAQGRLEVETIAQVIVLIQIIKIGDRRSPRDDAQVLTLSVFLAIAAMLDSNDVWTGAILIAFLPLLVITVMLYQLYKGAWEVGKDREGGGMTAAEVGGVEGWKRMLRRTSVFATVGTLGLSLFVFVLMPRGIGENVLGSFGTAQDRKRTGFNSSVTLGSGGLISSSPTVVFDLVLRDASGANIGSADIVQYLRGAVLTDYRDRRWTFEGDQRQESPASPERDPLKIAFARGPLIQQSVSLRASARGDRWMHLFAMWKPVQVQFGRNGNLEYWSTSMVMKRRAEAGPFDYTVWSVPYEVRPESSEGRTAVRYDNRKLAALAGSILQQAGFSPDPAERPYEEDGKAARAIQDHLRSGYQYTLDQQEPPKDADPVEHFLFERKAGHCEYFASAMVLLCRSVGINARLVTGYLATEFSTSLGSYTVRESNAHAWVEVEEDQHRWKRYDPTPPADLIRIHKPEVGILGRLRQAMEAVEYAWNSSIVAFNEGTRRSIFGQSTGRAEHGGWLATVERFSQRVRFGGVRLMLRAFVTGVVVFVVVAATGLALSALVRRLLGRRPTSGGNTAGMRREKIAYYRQLLRMLARRGLAKPGWQPPKAYAAALAGVNGELSRDVEQVVEAYYAQRFGGRPAKDAEMRAALRRIESFRAAREVGERRGL